MIQVVSTIASAGTFGPISGDTPVSLNIFSYPLPTNQYSNYTFTMALADRGKVLPLVGCSKNGFSLQLECRTPQLQTTLRTKKVISLYTNNLYSLSLDPKFTFYPNYQAISVLPSRYFKINNPTQVTLLMNPNFEFQTQNLKL